MFVLLMRFILLSVIITCFSLYVHAQEAPQDTSTKELGEIIISFNKWEQKSNEVPNAITRISKTQILRNNPQTTADLLAQSGTVFVQKSQLGGGSPMIRGFATNRVLLVVDGVRMNNAIYRSGNLQNIISIDPLALEEAEVVFGPGSLIYGSDAIGGVMDFHSLQPRLSKNNKLLFKGSALVRYSSANNENTFHTDINLGWKKWAFLSSLSYSKFDDLKMGKNGGQDSYLRQEYVQRINNTDSILQNSNPLIQKFTGYNQVNYIGKVRYRPTQHLNLQYSFTHATTGNAPRYDRLIQYKSGQLRFAEWYYGPMIWNMHNLQLLYSKQTKLYDEARVTAAYQYYQESRIDRARESDTRNFQKETVDAVSMNADANKTFTKGKLFYGLEYVYNKVGSAGLRTNIISNTSATAVSRYPDGSKWSTAGIYGSYKLNLNRLFTFTTGLRYNYNSLYATFDTTFIKFPYKEASIRNGALTANAGIVYRPLVTWQVNGNISTGYRMPNIDDVGKLFESAPGFVTVPNPSLKPEYAWNFETGIIKTITNKVRVEVTGFHTILTKAIVRRTASFNGADSILFDGVMSRVETLQNAAKATVWGLQVSAEVFITKQFSVVTHANWIGGKETDDLQNRQVPLRHAPPFYGSSFLRYKFKKIFLESSAVYNGKIENSKLAPVEQAKTEIYAKDANGKPFSPGWYMLTFRASIEPVKNLNITASFENITDQRYRSYSSGIVSAGSNFIISVRYSL